MIGKRDALVSLGPNQAFTPLGDDILRSHLAGKASGNAADFTVGVYPMLPDETCRRLGDMCGINQQSGDSRIGLRLPRIK
jgi:hypothetical protein